MASNDSEMQWRERLVSKILELPRFTRILICAVFAISVTLATSPIIDDIYLRHFYSEDTIIVPALIASALGIIMYAGGYFYIIGLAGEEPQQKAYAQWYVFGGILALIIVLIWAVRLVLLS